MSRTGPTNPRVLFLIPARGGSKGLPGKNAALVGGLSALGAGLYSIGIPKDSVVEYEAAVKAGKYVVVAHGTAAEAAKAREILNTSKAAQVTDHVLEPAMQTATL